MSAQSGTRLRQKNRLEPDGPASGPILLTGASGQLGAALLPGLRRRYGQQVRGLTRRELDLTQGDRLDACLERLQPRLILNTAAWTQVDLAERHPGAVMDINRDVPQQLARWAAAHGAPLIQLSTDYVFDGQARRPYKETDPVRPLSVYGRSKAQAETLILAEAAEAYIVRTSWLLSLQAPGFLNAILARAREGQPLRVVADRYGTPTPVDWLAAALLHLVERVLSAPGAASPGIYHLAGQGEASWWEVATFMLSFLRDHGVSLPFAPDAVQAIAATEYPSEAVRPDYSCLDSALFCQTFDWQPLRWRRGLAQLLSSMLPGPGER